MRISVPVSFWTLLVIKIDYAYAFTPTKLQSVGVGNSYNALQKHGDDNPQLFVRSTSQHLSATSENTDNEVDPDARHIRSAYLQWCKRYDKPADEKRYAQFVINYKVMQSIALKGGKPMHLNEFADYTGEEYETMLMRENKRRVALDSRTSKAMIARKRVERNESIDREETYITPKRLVVARAVLSPPVSSPHVQPKPLQRAQSNASTANYFASNDPETSTSISQSETTEEKSVQKSTAIKEDGYSQGDNSEGRGEPQKLSELSVVMKGEDTALLTNSNSINTVNDLWGKEKFPKMSRKEIKCSSPQMNRSTKKEGQKSSLFANAKNEISRNQQEEEIKKQQRQNQQHSQEQQSPKSEETPQNSSGSIKSNVSNEQRKHYDYKQQHQRQHQNSGRRMQTSIESEIVFAEKQQRDEKKLPLGSNKSSPVPSSQQELVVKKDIPQVSDKTRKTSSSPQNSPEYLSTQMAESIMNLKTAASVRPTPRKIITSLDLVKKKAESGEKKRMRVNAKAPKKAINQIVEEEIRVEKNAKKESIKQEEEKQRSEATPEIKSNEKKLTTQLYAKSKAFHRKEEDELRKLEEHKEKQKAEAERKQKEIFAKKQEEELRKLEKHKEKQKAEAERKQKEILAKKQEEELRKLEEHKEKQKAEAERKQKEIFAKKQEEELRKLEKHKEKQKAEAERKQKEIFAKKQEEELRKLEKHKEKQKAEAERKQKEILAKKQEEELRKLEKHKEKQKAEAERKQKEILAKKQEEELRKLEEHKEKQKAEAERKQKEILAKKQEEELRKLEEHKEKQKAEAERKQKEILAKKQEEELRKLEEHKEKQKAEAERKQKELKGRMMSKKKNLVRYVEERIRDEAGARSKGEENEKSKKVEELRLRIEAEEKARAAEEEKINITIERKRVAAKEKANAQLEAKQKEAEKVRWKVETEEKERFSEEWRKEVESAEVKGAEIKGKQEATEMRQSDTAVEKTMTMTEAQTKNCEVDFNKSHTVKGVLGSKDNDEKSEESKFNEKNCRGKARIWKKLGTKTKDESSLSAESNIVKKDEEIEEIRRKEIAELEALKLKAELNTQEKVEEEKRKIEEALKAKVENAMRKEEELHIRAAYLDWCLKFSKKPDKTRMKHFKQNYIALEEVAKEEGNEIKLNEYADYTAVEYHCEMQEKEAKKTYHRLEIEQKETEAMLMAAGGETGTLCSNDAIEEKRFDRYPNDDENIRVSVGDEIEPPEACFTAQKLQDEWWKEEEGLDESLIQSLGVNEDRKTFYVRGESEASATSIDHEVDPNERKLRKRVRTAYSGWCRMYNKEPDESRFPKFKSNYLIMEKLAIQQGREVFLNEFADCTPDEYEEASRTKSVALGSSNSHRCRNEEIEVGENSLEASNNIEPELIRTKRNIYVTREVNDDDVDQAAIIAEVESIASAKAEEAAKRVEEARARKTDQFRTAAEGREMEKEAKSEEKKREEVYRIKTGKAENVEASAKKAPKPYLPRKWERAESDRYQNRYEIKRKEARTPAFIPTKKFKPSTQGTGMEETQPVVKPPTVKKINSLHGRQTFTTNISKSSESNDYNRFDEYAAASWQKQVAQETFEPDEKLSSDLYYKTMNGNSDQTNGTSRDQIDTSPNALSYENVSPPLSQINSMNSSMTQDIDEAHTTTFNTMPSFLNESQDPISTSNSSREKSVVGASEYIGSYFMNVNTNSDEDPQSFDYIRNWSSSNQNISEEIDLTPDNSSAENNEDDGSTWYDGNGRSTCTNRNSSNSFTDRNSFIGKGASYLENLSQSTSLPSSNVVNEEGLYGTSNSKSQGGNLFPERIKAAYRDWCQYYGKEYNENRLSTFSSNFLAVERYHRETGVSLILNELADMSSEEFQQNNN